MIDDSLSTQIVQFIGRECNRAPWPSLARVDAEYSDAVRNVSRSLLDIEIDWDTLGWKGGLECAKEVIAAQFPQLTQEARDDLFWYFSFEVRAVSEKKPRT